MRSFLVQLGTVGLLAAPAWAQQAAPPALPAAPVVAAPGSELGKRTTPTYVLGHRYEVTLVSGTHFVGKLTLIGPERMEFATDDLGHLLVLRATVQQLLDISSPPATGRRAGYFDIGNGPQLFAAPTGRGLRQGEGTLQVTNLFLIGAEYGITDNISLGASFSAFPWLGLGYQLVVVSPKVSFPVGNNWHIGAGILYGGFPFASSDAGGFGIGYGSLTYGGASDNLTVGVGYGFVQGDIGRTPVFQVSGQKRIARRLSLVSENYIVGDSRAGLGGLYGVKLHWSRTSFGMGAAYYYTFRYEYTDRIATYDPTTGTYTYQTYVSQKGGHLGSSYILPVYLNFSFRFGKPFIAKQ